MYFLVSKHTLPNQTEIMSGGRRSRGAAGLVGPLDTDRRVVRSRTGLANVIDHPVQAAAGVATSGRMVTRSQSSSSSSSSSSAAPIIQQGAVDIVAANELQNGIAVPGGGGISADLSQVGTRAPGVNQRNQVQYRSATGSEEPHGFLVQGGVLAAALTDPLDVVPDIEEQFAFREDIQAKIARLEQIAINWPLGYALENTNLIRGISVREIRDVLSRAGINLKQVYVSGSGWDLTGGYTQSNRTAPNALRNTGFITYRPVTIGLYCLDELDYPDRLDASRNLDTLQDYVTYLREEVISQESRVDSWVLFDNIRIVRRNVYNIASALDGPENNFPQFQRRIAGFDRLFTWDSETPFCGSAVSGEQEDQSVYRLFVPGGQKNCVLAAFKWALYKYKVDHVLYYYSEMAVSNPALREDMLFQECEALVDTLFEDFKKIALNCRLQTNPSLVRQRGTEVAMRKFVRDFNDKTRHGYSPNLLNKFIDYVFVQERIVLNVSRWKSYRNGALSPNRVSTTAINSVIRASTFLREPPPIVLQLIQIDINGRIVGDDSPVEKGEDSLIDCAETKPNDVSMLIHAAAIYPTPASSQLVSILKSDYLKNAIKNTVDTFLKIADSNVLDSVSASRVRELIVEQNERSEQLRTILKDSFENQQKDSNDSIPKLAGPLNGESVEGGVDDVVMGDAECEEESEIVLRLPEGVRPGIRLLVYDIETVENMRGIQDELVYEPLRKPVPPNLPNTADVNWYTIPEAHIPYTVQWALIDEAESDPPINHSIGVRIEWGSGKLGKCVDDFLDAVKECGERLAVRKFYAYAHNGCGFDAYLIKACNTKYPLKRILVTPRGILSLSIQLGAGCEIIFRDTKVFFASRLSELCAVFKVPTQYCKTDFPITRIHARNCFDPYVIDAVKEYMENDVYSLAYIVCGINNVIRKTSELAENVLKMGKLIKGHNPAYGDAVPPIAQFVTLMSAVKRYQKQLFFIKYQMPSPIPVDIPSLRKWIQYATVGGRVTPYWKAYKSALFYRIVKTFCTNTHCTKELLQNCHKEMLDNDRYCQVWDVTSLYPYAMTEYPMPCLASNPICYLKPEECMERVNALECSLCEEQWRLCEDHRPGGDKCLSQLGFAFIIIKNLQPPRVEGCSGGDDDKEAICLLNIIPRKLEKGAGLVYSHQTQEQLKGYHNNSTSISFPDHACYTFYDIYWMKRAKYTFDVVGGILFDTSFAFREYTNTLFTQRIHAKEEEKRLNLPKSLSTFYKLICNGGYGINAQQDICETMILVDDGVNEAKLRADHKISPDERIVNNCHSHQTPTLQWILKLEKVPGSCEYYSPQSPNQIGAAVTAISRHHMNLAMFNLCTDGQLVGYTDTDSMALHAKGIRKHFTNKSMYNESANAPLGTYKNDHETGKNELIFLSLFITKKVKLHITIDADGELRFYPTFKGYNPSAVDPITGEKVPLWKIEQLKVLAIVEAFFSGEMGGVTQTEFKRSLANGVTIIKDSKFSASMEAFTGSNGKGSFIKEIDGTGDFVEVLVPHGSKFPNEKVEHWFFRDVENNPHCPKENVQNPSSRVDAWKDLGLTIEVVTELVLKFYEKYENELTEAQHNPNSVEISFDKVFDNAPKIKPEDYFWRQ